MEKNVLDVFSKPDNKIYFIFQNFFYYLQQTIKYFTLYTKKNNLIHAWRYSYETTHRVYACGFTVRRINGL